MDSACGSVSSTAKQWLSSRPPPSSLLVASTSPSPSPASASSTPGETSAVEARLAGEGRGLGLFLCRPISASSPILHDVPAIVMKPTDDLPQLYEQFHALPEFQRRTYLSLTHHSTPDGEARLWQKLVDRGYDTATVGPMVQVASIMQTNAFNVDLGDGVGPTHRALFLNVARINHSCAPNAHVCFYPPSPSRPSGQMVIHALRDLRAGEEVLIAYFSILLPRAERQVKAQKWGFTCMCPACDIASVDQPLLERRRKAINDFTAKQTLVMHSSRPSVKQIRDLVDLGSALIEKTGKDSALAPALPDLYDLLGLLEAKNLLVQRKESYREAVVAFLEQAVVCEARITGPLSPATARRLEKLQQFAARKTSSSHPTLSVGGATDYAVVWVED